MDAQRCTEFLNWFEELPTLKTVFLDDTSSVRITALTDTQVRSLMEATSLNLIEKFPWLSDELFGIQKEFESVASQQREMERSEILRVATLKREREAKSRPRLFLTKRAQWEHDTHISQLERMKENLEDEKSHGILLKERAKLRRLEYLESLEKLPFAHTLKACDHGIFRMTRTGIFVRHRLMRIGVEKCQGWTLKELLTFGHLLGP